MGDEVLDALWGKVELTSNIFRALNHYKAAFRIPNDHVAGWCPMIMLPLWKIECPFVAKANQCRQKGQTYIR